MQVINFTPIKTTSYTNNNNYKQNLSYTSPAFKSNELIDILSNITPPQPPKPYEEMLKEISSLKIPVKDMKKGAISLKKLKNFTIDEYKKLSKTDLDNIDLIANEFINNNPHYLGYDTSFNKKLEYNEIIANGIKKKCDSIFGEGKYVIIPIGRSLSSVGKSLTYKIGEDNVKQLPLSKAHRYINLEEECTDENFNSLNKYLKSVGLSKKEIEKSKKQYIFIDYCSSGKSLIGARNLFKSDKVYGKQNNVKFINVMHLLKKTELDNTTNDFFLGSDTLLDDLEKTLNFSHFKKYSTVKNCFNLNDIKASIIKPEYRNFESRVFLYKLLDNAMKKRG